MKEWKVASHMSKQIYVGYVKRKLVFVKKIRNER